MNTEQDTKPEKSEEYKNFENLLRQVASVPKEEVDRSIQREKEAKAKQKQTPAK